MMTIDSDAAAIDDLKGSAVYVWHIQWSLSLLSVLFNMFESIPASLLMIAYYEPTNPLKHSYIKPRGYLSVSMALEVLNSSEPDESYTQSKSR